MVWFLNRSIRSIVGNLRNTDGLDQTEYERNGDEVYSFFLVLENKSLTIRCSLVISRYYFSKPN